MGKLAGIALLLPALAASAEAAIAVACHTTYGGETREVIARPAPSPYGVEALQIGTYFRFRAVLQSAPAGESALKVYTYADRDDGPVLIHQGTYPYPPARARGIYGFTGLHLVYEPMLGGELQYWCEGRSGKQRPK